MPRKNRTSGIWASALTIGQRFGLLTVESMVKNGRTWAWTARCDCGETKSGRAADIRRAWSCGCTRMPSRTCKRYRQTHGAEYKAWCSLKHRCENPNSKSFHNYGGRGITVCERWRSSFESFLSDMGCKPSPRHSLDRINNDGNYEPGNCRWATLPQQKANTRKSKFCPVAVCLIRHMSRRGADEADIAWAFGTRPYYIRYLATGKRWKSALDAIPQEQS